VGKVKKEKLINFCVGNKQAASSSAFTNTKQLPMFHLWSTSHWQKENAKKNLISSATALHVWIWITQKNSQKIVSSPEEPQVNDRKLQNRALFY